MECLRWGVWRLSGWGVDEMGRNMGGAGDHRHHVGQIVLWVHSIALFEYTVYKMNKEQNLYMFNEMMGAAVTTSSEFDPCLL